MKKLKAIWELMRLEHGIMIAIAIIDSKPDPFSHSCTKCGKKTGAERLDNMNINRIKDDVRVQYGNILHSADTEEKAIEELMKLGVDKSIIDMLYKKTDTIKMGDVKTKDKFIEQLNTLENGVKIWKPE